MAAILKVWRQIENQTPSIDENLHEEHYCQISSKSDLKWLSKSEMAFSKRLSSTRRTKWVAICDQFRGPIHERSQIAVAHATIANRICDVASYSVFTKQIAGATMAKRVANDSKICDVPFVFAKTCFTSQIRVYQLFSSSLSRWKNLFMF